MSINHPTDVANLHLDRHLPAGTFDDKCQKQVRDWLLRCYNSHATCNEDWSTGGTFFMRLLKIGRGSKQAVLEEYPAGVKRPQYVTMSHCWDSSSRGILLDSTTIRHLTNGFELRVLPKKFQDGVAVAQWMGIDYIWIDQLCIKQDSPSDWQEQSSFMGDIYAGSLCNIAATTENANPGLFRDRPVEVVEPFCTSDPSRTTDETYVIGYDDFWCNSLLDAKLHTRGWVLQERLLAPRTVHFGKEQIFWECRVSKACEAYPDGLPEQFINHRTTAWREGEQVLSPNSHAALPNNDPASASSMSDISTRNHTSNDVKRLWTRIVESYMSCDLTYSSDKLVAISGLASKLQKVTKTSYLAGLWYDDTFPQSLLWFVPASKQTDGRQSVRYPSLGSRDYRAPSWSWASIDASITWISTSSCDKLLVDITEAQTTPTGTNLVGAVSSAVISASGQIIPIHISITNSQEDGTYTIVPRREDSTTDCRTRISDIDTSAELQPLIYLDTELWPDPCINAYILPICTQWRAQSGRIIASVAGLLLRRKHSDFFTTYERLGIVGLTESEAESLHISSDPVHTASFEIV